MAYQISGIILQIGNTESIPYQDKVFRKRELVLDCSYRNNFTGEVERANYPKFEFTGIHVDDLNSFKTGDIVTVSFALNGGRSERDGVTRYFTNIQGYKIESYQRRTQQVSNQAVQWNQAQQSTNYPKNGFQSPIAQQIPETKQVQASQQPFPPAVDGQGIPVATSNDDLPF